VRVTQRGIGRQGARIHCTGTSSQTWLSAHVTSCINKKNCVLSQAQSRGLHRHRRRGQGARAPPKFGKNIFRAKIM